MRWNIQDVIRYSFYKESWLRATSFRKIQWIKLSLEITNGDFAFHERLIFVARLKTTPLTDVRPRGRKCPVAMKRNAAPFVKRPTAPRKRNSDPPCRVRIIKISCLRHEWYRRLQLRCVSGSGCEWRFKCTPGMTVRMISAKSGHAKGPYVFSSTFPRVLTAVWFILIYISAVLPIYACNSRNAPGKLSLLRISRFASEWWLSRSDEVFRRHRADRKNRQYLVSSRGNLFCILWSYMSKSLLTGKWRKRAIIEMTEYEETNGIDQNRSRVWGDNLHALTRKRKKLFEEYRNKAHIIFTFQNLWWSQDNASYRIKF